LYICSRLWNIYLFTMTNLKISTILLQWAQFRVFMLWNNVQYWRICVRIPTGCVCTVVCYLDTSTIRRPRPGLGCWSTSSYTHTHTHTYIYTHSHIYTHTCTHTYL
jgi:hypothetical protein